jgi:hypothetical protein
MSPRRPPSREAQLATNIITAFFKRLKESPKLYVSGRDAGIQMVQLYRLLTGEMPQSPGIEYDFSPEEMPALEWASPTERDPDKILCVHPGSGTSPDIILKGDQDDEGTAKKELGAGQLQLKGRSDE